MSKTVLVTGIGGNVAQGILRNIRCEDKDIILIGTNTEQVSPGNHLCNAVYKVPFASDSGFIPAMHEICEKHQVDLVVPSTDYEGYYLGLEKKSLPDVAVSSPEVTSVFLNKYKTWQNFNQLELPFAETVLPSEYNGQFKEIIVKPAEGRGSRDIYVNHADPTSFSDDFIIQRLYRGSEITTAFYVRRDGGLHGHITMTRELYAGATSKCEVTFEYDTRLKKIIKRIMEHYAISGSANIQSIVNSSGEIIPFEINCRISGTNSIRSHFGFKDVRYTLDEYLYGRKPEKAVITTGSAVRMLCDIIYPGRALKDIFDGDDSFTIF